MVRLPSTIALAALRPSSSRILPHQPSCPSRIAMFSSFRFRKSKSGEQHGEMHHIFTKYSKDGLMDAENLLAFLQTEQGETMATLEHAQHLMQQHRQESNKHLHKLHDEDLNSDSFVQFLFNTSLTAPIDSSIHQDMTHPVSEYYIYTGHNSYLTGNQLSSNSSDVPIVEALRRGVRVIELDLWPDPKDGGIKVTHGKTMTNPVDFEKCIRAINENAFSASQYPVCITLEDHLSSPLQVKAAEILLRVLGSTLYYPQTDDELMKEFPSPESLKGRIIISTKPPVEGLQEAQAANQAPVRQLEKVDKEEKKKRSPVVKEEALAEKVEKFQIDGADTKLHGGKTGVVDEDEVPKSREYSRLITIRQKKPVSGTVVKDQLAVEEVVKRISLGEEKLEEVAEEFPELLVKFTQRNILRVYPSGVRVDSSNYNPVLAWTHGAQMVALNMQGYGRPLWLAQGLFKANGGCGYVRKPKFLLESGHGGAVFNPKVPLPVKQDLKVKVIMSLGWKERFSKRHFDFFSPPDFFTKVAIEGVPADKAKRKTLPVDDTWIPTWDAEFNFLLTVPELALLRVEVKDHDNENRDAFAAQTCLPVVELKAGYRCLQLYDKKGNELSGVRMLMYFQLSNH